MTSKRTITPTSLRKEIRRMYAAGSSIQEIMDTLNCTKYQVSWFGPQRVSGSLTQAQYEAIVEMREEKVPARIINEETGIGLSLINEIAAGRITGGSKQDETNNNDSN